MAIEQENFYAALITALTIPDICVALEHGNTTGKEYAKWFDSNLDYKNFLSGNDCYALRCSVLHQGTDDITEQRMREVLEHYIFLTKGSHRILFKNCIFNGVNKSFLQLNVTTFCIDICTAAEVWIKNNTNNSSIQNRLQQTLEIHEPGYTYMGTVRFG